MTRFEEAAAAAAVLGADALDALAERVGAGWPAHAILGDRGWRFDDAAAPVLAALDDGVPPAEAAAYLRGLAAGLRGGRSPVTVETVWSGPASHAVPVRATAQVLLDVIGAASDELAVMTYSARPHGGIRAALAEAAARGVAVTVVVETLRGAGGALDGAEPADAFAGIDGVRLWHWPTGRRTVRHGRMHAKLAVCDRRMLLVSSANLTQSGVAANIEAGLLVRGGPAPQRAAEHIDELKAAGVLRPLRAGRDA
ncbi:endonuclease [Thermobifida halotolerans]|uniref:Endonuclease n=1 Tax=Thermobifida halotolerans TaxID=483545 RepID=A0AA97LV41_9ACTN|nr:DISARM system phospholipase D-like protein DrmC [Thermobifida halotolerans]UOE18601.1 endonuclease [Thermobifida halotolerans]